MIQIGISTYLLEEEGCLEYHESRYSFLELDETIHAYQRDEVPHPGSQMTIWGGKRIWRGGSGSPRARQSCQNLCQIVFRSILASFLL